MDAADRAYFKAKLEALAEEIAATLARRDAASSSIAPDNAIGRLTRMEAIQAQSISSAGRARLQGRLKQIRRVLAQFDAATYGQCVTCGEAIPRGRLEIMPETRLCVACAQRRR